MKVIEQEIHSLKNSISEMWALVHQQLYNAGEAMLTGDKELAYKVISRERRVNIREMGLLSASCGFSRKAFWYSASALA